VVAAGVTSRGGAAPAHDVSGQGGEQGPAAQTQGDQRPQHQRRKGPAQVVRAAMDDDELLEREAPGA